MLVKTIRNKLVPSPLQSDNRRGRYPLTPPPPCGDAHGRDALHHKTVRRETALTDYFQRRNTSNFPIQFGQPILRRLCRRISEQRKTFHCFLRVSEATAVGPLTVCDLRVWRSVVTNPRPTALHGRRSRSSVCGSRQRGRTDPV